MRSSHFRVCALFFLLAHATGAQAGMPSIRLSDVGRMRLQSISFFLAGFLVTSLCVKLLWNHLRRDWTFLPRLSYSRALVVVGLWGLLFVLVLTMISGARELMTPGAWEKQGNTYRLARSDTSTGDLDLRRRALRFEFGVPTIGPSART